MLQQPLNFIFSNIYGKYKSSSAITAMNILLSTLNACLETANIYINNIMDSKKLKIHQN